MLSCTCKHVNSSSTDRTEEVTGTQLGCCKAAIIKKAELKGVSHNFIIYQQDRVKGVNADMCCSHL